ncbi:3-dehydroquinate synthase [Brevundimonas sp. UBA2416]|uniref:3-dehydroquinate synthase n=1 Tax=Brevundimonas sp. UBA2416 TaxID=1946124 RepID=UPI0025B7FC73|nr:3-dehydroquinate synthase family protein [Brevundimonas sp. UBA2416]HRJ62966.1 3-dehydroquinate synthase family protein [Brevundimonas sp.]
MSASFEIRAASGTYTARIQPGSLEQVVERGGDIVILCDAYFADRFEGRGVPVISLPALETTKSLDEIPRVIAALREAGASRRTRLIAVGGGIVQDVAGFVASVYMRGVKWDYAPTTLLAMVDSCIGGKSSINVGPYKNLVGTFHPPQTILIDPGLCETLSADQRIAGLCEAAKICFARSPETFEAYLALEPVVAAGPEALSEVIGLSLASKKWFLEIDEFDQAERLLLNYGHTFGHAIESASDFRLSHGIAVGLGMMAAGAMSRSLGRVAVGDGPTARFEAHIDGLLLQMPELGPLVADLSSDRLIAAFRSDKKHTADTFAVVLPLAAGGVERVDLGRGPETEALIQTAFDQMKARYAA